MILFNYVMIDLRCLVARAWHQIVTDLKRVDNYSDRQFLQRCERSIERCEEFLEELQQWALWPSRSDGEFERLIRRIRRRVDRARERSCSKGRAICDNADHFLGELERWKQACV